MASEKELKAVWDKIVEYEDRIAGLETQRDEALARAEQAEQYREALEEITEWTNENRINCKAIALRALANEETR